MCIFKVLVWNDLREIKMVSFILILSILKKIKLLSMRKGKTGLTFVSLYFRFLSIFEC